MTIINYRLEDYSLEYRLENCGFQIQRLILKSFNFPI